MLCQNLGIVFKVRWLILKVPPLGSEPLYLSYCLQCGCDVWCSSSHDEDMLQHKNGSHVWREQRRHGGSLGPGECLGPGPAQDAQSISVLIIIFYREGINISH